MYPHVRIKSSVYGLFDKKIYHNINDNLEFSNVWKRKENLLLEFMGSWISWLRR